MTYFEIKYLVQSLSYRDEGFRVECGQVSCLSPGFFKDILKLISITFSFKRQYELCLVNSIIKGI